MPDAKAQFARLEAQKGPIEADVGEPLTWHNPPNKQMCRIYLQRQAQLGDRSKWPEYQGWLLQKLEALHRTFAVRIKALPSPSTSDLQEHQTPSPLISMTVPAGAVGVRAGETRRFPIRIDRQNVEGGVLVQFENQQSGITLPELTIHADQAEGQASVTAGAQAQVRDYSVVAAASCDSVSARKDMTIRVVP